MIWGPIIIAGAAAYSCSGSKHPRLLSSGGAVYASRREAIVGAAAVSLGVARPASAAIDPKATGRVYGVEEDAPFRAALEQISTLLDRLGVEGAVEKKREEPPPGPPIKRSYSVGLKDGTDRLRGCPEAERCLSSARAEKSDRTISPFVYFDQKGDAVGRLIETLYAARDAQLLVARGNFFNGAGVYVLAELSDLDAIHDVEFQFLPGVLESVVDVRITLREGPDAAADRQKYLVRALGDALGWLPLADINSNDLDKDQRDILEASRTEMRYRDKFEAEMEKADADLAAAMEKERKRIDELKKEVRDLLDALSLQEDARMNEYQQLRSRTLETRDEYERGVADRLGGFKNTGRYGATQNIRLGNSFAGLINSQDDVLSKIYDQAQPDDK
ncbi:hypothetical protein CTAYLR_003350 [Chrysophaeum taylorii]|uniref:Uncharacterized protein n=1 Tax=Chrysophaeum taylorii TaxID=2483200 RepID=A0AAD7XMA3_9STRA|nr:hypothetical protein CTAYLR_003350 [Chrysophaeum taylorii]